MGIPVALRTASKRCREKRGNCNWVKKVKEQKIKRNKILKIRSEIII